MKKIYVVTAADRLKIGVATDVTKRVKQLRIGCPNIEVAYESGPISNAFKVEKKLHKEFEEFSIGNEWFSGLDCNSAVERVRSAVYAYGNFEEEEESAGDESFNGLLKWVFSDWEEHIRCMEKEIEEINKDIECLKEQALDMGFSELEIQTIIDNAGKEAEENIRRREEEKMRRLYAQAVLWTAAGDMTK